MVSLQVSTGITEGEVFFGPLFAEAGAMLVQEVRQAERQRPEADDGRGPHQLVMVRTQQVFEVLEEDLDVPADGEDVDDRLRVGIHQGGAPVAGLLRGGVQAEAGDQDQGRAQFAHPGADGVDIDGVTALLRGPDGFLPVLRSQRSRVLGQGDPLAAAVFGDDAHLSVALQPSADVPSSLPCRLAHPLAVVPGVHQDVSMGASYRPELLDCFHGQIHLALEGNPLPLTDHPLPVQPGLQRAAAAQQDVQPGEEAMATHNPLLGPGVMPSQATHLPPLGLGAHRIVEDQETCHYGLPRTPPTLRPSSPQTAMFGLDQRLHLLPETSQPRCHNLGGRPRPAAQETRETREADAFPDAFQEPGERTAPLPLNQPQQYGDEVLPLAPTETRAERLEELAQGIGQAYNRLGHGSPQGQKGLLRYPIIPGKSHACYSAVKVQR